MGEQAFLEKYVEAVHTTLGFFWMALWAFVLGYAISSLIQVLFPKTKMKSMMGSSNSKGVLIGSLFGFLSSSCSFSALATTKALIKKGAGFIPSIAFLLASTNLVIELGIVISIFLSWQFIVGEYIGGLLLIIAAWIIIKLTPHKHLVENARKRLGASQHDENENGNWIDKLKSLQTWNRIAENYFMEWKMVWKDVTIGFTLAGIISVFVPESFFETMFVQTGSDQQTFEFLVLLEHVVAAPLAAFCTFIGSMGNIPLASVLYSNGVSFAGIMAFIFSDLVVFPVLRINATYYGWKMSFYILGVLLLSLIIVSLTLHYGFSALDLIPDFSQSHIPRPQSFQIDYTFFLNLIFLFFTGILAFMAFKKKDRKHQHHDHSDQKSVLDKVLLLFALLSYLWIGSGLILSLII